MSFSLCRKQELLPVTLCILCSFLVASCVCVVVCVVFFSLVSSPIIFFS